MQQDINFIKNNLNSRVSSEIESLKNSLLKNEFMQKKDFIN